MSNVGEVVIWDYNGQDNQLWYWDGPNRDVLRNKQFPNRVRCFIRTYSHESFLLDLWSGLGFPLE